MGNVAVGCSFGGFGRWYTAKGDNYGDPALRELYRHCLQPVISALSPMVINLHVLAVGMPFLLEALRERRDCKFPRVA